MVHNSLCVIFMILVSLENVKKMCFGVLHDYYFKDHIFFLKFFLTLLVSSGLLGLKTISPKNHSHKNENKIVKLRYSASLCVRRSQISIEKIWPKINFDFLADSSEIKSDIFWPLYGQFPRPLFGRKNLPKCIQ